jgi:hypothetical protein
MKFVPANDLSTSAVLASSITTVDFGFIRSGEDATRAIRVGNATQDHQFYVLDAASHAEYSVVISPAESISLEPDEISDTTSITIELPLDVASGSRSVDLLATTDAGTFVLRLDYIAVGVNKDRNAGAEYPERATSFTDNLSDVLLRFAEPLRLFTFEPIPFDPDDRRVIVDFSKRRHLGDGLGDHNFISQDVKERLNPLNSTWGYVRSESIILGSFQDETTGLQANFEALNTLMLFTSTAKLYVLPEYEFPRTWALFDPSGDPDSHQYKRTVYVIHYRGCFWNLHDIHTQFRGNELAFHEINLVQIEPQNMGSPAFYNPWAWTYRHEQDKPYAKFAVDTPDLREVLSDSSGSNSSNTSNFAGSNEPAAPQSDEEDEESEPDPPAPILSLTIVGDDSIVTVENLSVAPTYSVENAVPGDIIWTILTFPSTIDLTMYGDYIPVTLPHTQSVELYLDAPGTIGVDGFVLQAEDSLGNTDTIEVSVNVTDAPPVLQSAQFTTSPRRVTAFFTESLQSFSNSGSMFDIRDDANDVVTITSASCTGNSQVIIAITGLLTPKTLNYDATGETLTALDDGALVASFNNELIT